MKALIIDGEELYRLSLREVISVAGNFSDILEASNEHEFFSRAANHTDLGLVVWHPASLGNSGRDFLKLIERLYPKAAIITILDHANRTFGAVAGTHSVMRSASVSQLVGIIRRALKLPLEGFGASCARPGKPNVARMLGQNSSYDVLSDRHDTGADLDVSRLSYRQRQILAMAADGLPNKEIAARLDIAEGTVKAHMHAIFKVLGVSNRTQAVIRYSSLKQGSARKHAPQDYAHATAS